MDKQLSVKLPPSLTAETSVKIWEQVLGAQVRADYFWCIGSYFLRWVRFDLLYELRSRPDDFKLINVSAGVETLYSTMLKNFSPKPVEKKSLDIISSLGKWLYDAASSTKQSITFLGSACCCPDRSFVSSLPDPLPRNSFGIRRSRKQSSRHYLPYWFPNGRHYRFWNCFSCSNFRRRYFRSEWYRYCND